MVRGHRYWDTALFQWDTKLSRSSSILRYWAFSQDTEPRPKKTVIGYWDTELRRRTKILRYWDTELRQAEKDTEILSFARRRKIKILRYYASPDGERYWDTVLRRRTKILGYCALCTRYWDTKPCRPRKILRYWASQAEKNTEILRYAGILAQNDHK